MYEPGQKASQFLVYIYLFPEYSFLNIQPRVVSHSRAKTNWIRRRLRSIFIIDWMLKFLSI